MTETGRVEPGGRYDHALKPWQKDWTSIYRWDDEHGKEEPACADSMTIHTLSAPTWKEQHGDIHAHTSSDNQPLAPQRYACIQLANRRVTICRELRMLASESKGDELPTVQNVLLAPCLLSSLAKQSLLLM